MTSRNRARREAVVVIGCWSASPSIAPPARSFVVGRKLEGDERRSIYSLRKLNHKKFGMVNWNCYITSSSISASQDEW